MSLLSLRDLRVSYFFCGVQARPSVKVRARIRMGMMMMMSFICSFRNKNDIESWHSDLFFFLCACLFCVCVTAVAPSVSVTALLPLLLILGGRHHSQRLQAILVPLGCNPRACPLDEKKLARYTAAVTLRRNHGRRYGLDLNGGVLRLMG